MKALRRRTTSRALSRRLRERDAVFLGDLLCDSSDGVLFNQHFDVVCLRLHHVAVIAAQETASLLAYETPRRLEDANVIARPVFVIDCIERDFAEQLGPRAELRQCLVTLEVVFCI